jgi:predicted TIM-barrel fold metal-dependent hydrolase
MEPIETASRNSASTGTGDTAQPGGESQLDRRAFLAGLARSAATAGTAAAALALGPRTGGADREDKAPLIDTHMHVWADDTERFPFAHPYDPKFKPPKTAGTAELLLKEMDAEGVTHCVLVQVIYHGWDNRYVAHCVKAHPKRFRGQGLIDPTDPKVADKLEFWVKRHGLSGMRFSPIYYPGKDGWLNARASDALWEKAEGLKAVFNFFIAAPQLPKLEDMVRRFPKVRVVIDHLARVDLKAADPLPELRKLLALAKYPGVWVKVSELSVVSPSGKYPYRDTFPWVKRLYEAFGPDRLLWGTGFPGATRAEAGRPSLQQELDLVRKEVPFFTPVDREKVLGRNAAKLWAFGP